MRNESKKEKDMKREKLILMLMVAFGLFAFTACQDNNRQNQAESERDEMVSPTGDQDRVSQNQNDFSARIEGDEEISTFSMGMTRAELTDDFAEGEGPYTVFAPDNAAYDKLSQEERQRIEASIKSAGSSTNYLVVNRELPEDQLRESIQNVGGDLELITLQGERLIANLDGEDIVLRDGRGNTATIKRADSGESDIIVHVIDNVLQPEDIDRNDFVERNFPDAENTTGTDVMSDPTETFNADNN